MRLALAAVLVAAASAPALAHGHRHHHDVMRDEPSPRALATQRAPHPVTVYLNAGGGVIKGGDDDSETDTSSIVWDVADHIKVPAWKGGAKRWAQVVQCVQDGFADFDIDVVTERPTDGSYVMIMVGGMPSLVGYGKQVGGIAPYTGEVIGNAIGFVFSADLGNDAAETCIDILHETGHTLGLDHETNACDPMSYDWNCEDKKFQDVASRCGEEEGSERDCGDGNPMQNSYEILAANVGLRDHDDEPSGPIDEPNPPDDQPNAPDDQATAPGCAMTVAIDDPGESLVGNQWIEIDVRTSGEVDDVELGWASQSQQYVFDCNAIGDDQPAECERDGDVWRFQLKVGVGLRALAARATSSDGTQLVTDAQMLELQE